MLNLLLVGGSGFIGKLLLNNLNSDSYSIQVVGRKEFANEELLRLAIVKADVIINLAGASITKRWTKVYKMVLLSSRIEPINRIASIIKDLQCYNKILINASAIGVYPENLASSEESTQLGNDFMANLVLQWENAVLNNKDLFAAVYILRFGVVFDESGGFLAKLKPSFRFGLGAVFGNKNAYISFISSYDLVSAIDFIIKNKPSYLIYNLVAPLPIAVKVFANLYAQRFHMPRLFYFPSWVFKWIFGEAAQALLSSKIVYPVSLLESGFIFKYGSFDSYINYLKNVRKV